MGLSLIENSGKLEELALPDLLTAICAPGETGVLRLTRHGISKMIYIQEGRIVFATSTDPDDRLGELLLRKGLLSVQHVEEASARLTERKRLGTLLVELGYLKAEELVRAVIEQVKEIVFDLFRWYDGEYLFSKGTLPSREVITLKLSTAEVILGGIQRIDRWSRVLRGLGGLEARFVAAAAYEKETRHMQLREEHALVLDATRQPISVRDLCRMGLMNDFELCRTLWAFRVIGLAQPVASEPGFVEASSDPRTILEAALQREVPDEGDGAAEMPTDTGATWETGAPQDDAPVLELVEEASAKPTAQTKPPAQARTPALPQPSAPAIPAPATRGTPTAKAPRPPKPPAAPPPAAASLDEGDVESTIAEFNERHRRLVSLLRSNGGPRADDIVRRSLAMVGKDLPGLFDGLAPETDGSFNPEALKTNIFAFGVVGYAAGLEMLVERELERAGSLLGPGVQRQIASQLKTVGVS